MSNQVPELRTFGESVKNVPDSGSERSRRRRRTKINDTREALDEITRLGEEYEALSPEGAAAIRRGQDNPNWPNEPKTPADVREAEAAKKREANNG